MSVMLMYEQGGMAKRIGARTRLVLAKRRGGVKTALVLFSLLVGVCQASAMEVDDLLVDEGSILDQRVASGIRFSSPIEAYRQGKAAYDEGWYGLALPALRYAADKGIFGARLKLARMYELGLGVPRNDAGAFELYQSLSEKNWNISSYHPAAPAIGYSLGALGRYYLHGVETIGLKPDVRRAARHFTHAAQYFGDPRAQYELARLYLSGRGVKKNVRRAIGWLNNASRKKYAPAQALLGQLFWAGELVPKRRVKALALLAVAEKNAGPQDSEWISGLYKTIAAKSELKTRTGAKAVVARWVRIYRPKNGKGRIIIRKEVRIGIAEGGARASVRRRSAPAGSVTVSVRRVRSERPRSNRNMPDRGISGRDGSGARSRTP